MFIGTYQPWGISETGATKAEVAKRLGHPEDQLTWQEFDDRDWILRGIPKEFHAPLGWIAYEQGHSCGEDEVIGILRDLVANLEPAIKAFHTRIYKESQPEHE